MVERNINTITINEVKTLLGEAIKCLERYEDGKLGLRYDRENILINIRELCNLVIKFILEDKLGEDAGHANDLAVNILLDLPICIDVFQRFSDWDEIKWNWDYIQRLS